MRILALAARWGSAAASALAAAWSAFLGYMAQSWAPHGTTATALLPGQASLAANAVVASGWMLWVFALLAGACAAFITRRDVPALFALLVGCALLLAAFVFNVVVSVGFELLSTGGHHHPTM